MITAGIESRGSSVQDGKVDNFLGQRMLQSNMSLQTIPMLDKENVSEHGYRVIYELEGSHPLPVLPRLQGALFRQSGWL